MGSGRVVGCKKAWIHPTWRALCSNGTIDCMKRKRTRSREEERGGASETGHSDDFFCAERRAGFLAQDHEASSVEMRCAGVGRLGGRRQTLEEILGKEEIAAQHWQCDSEVQGVENRPRRKDELRSLEMAKAEGGATRIAPANVPSRFCPL